METSNRISVEDSGTLRIQDTTQEDTGVYVCIAYNVAGEKESIPCQLTVKGNWALLYSACLMLLERSVANGCSVCLSVCPSVTLVSHAYTV